MNIWEKIKTQFKHFVIHVRRFRKLHPVKTSLLASLMIFGLSLVLVHHSINKKQADLRNRLENIEHVSLQRFSQLLNEGKVDEVIFYDTLTQDFMSVKEKSFVEIKTNDKKSFVWEKNENLALQEGFGKMLFENSIKKPIKISTGTLNFQSFASKGLGVAFLICLVLTIIAFTQGLLVGVTGGSSFRPQKPDGAIGFDDIIGYEEVKRQLKELKDQLSHPEKYEKRGVLPPKGILFTGGPGVGKTMLAKALANEMGADMFTCTGADFAELYVGVGAKKMRSLFRMARQSPLAVIFIDEIDALGSRQTMGNDTERLSVLNTILSEMDGVNSNKQMVVVGATNLPHMLDPALKRPGRFDYSVSIPLPDIKTREGILGHYLKEGKGHDVDLHALALRTQGYSGAQLRNMVLEAKRLAVREKGLDHDWSITQDLLHRAQEISLLGINEIKSNGEDLIRVAVHELGHALTCYLFCPDFYVEKVTVEGRGNALGYAVSRPTQERMLVTEDQMKGRLIHYLGGRAAEDVVFGGVTGGAADDIKKSNDLARDMVLHYGMGEKTRFSQPTSQHGGFDHTQETREDIQKILDDAYSAAKEIIASHKEWIKEMTFSLMEKKSLHHKEMFKNIPLPLSAKSEGEQWLSEVVERTKRNIH